MIVLFTDFGVTGPYVGQMKAAIIKEAPNAVLVDLMHDAPRCDPRRAAYLLEAYKCDFPRKTIFLCVVDPGVGSDRLPGILEVDGQSFIGPDNGLFEFVIRRSADTPIWREILWRPTHLSASFHGRDLFAPVAARQELGLPIPSRGRSLNEVERLEWPDDLAEVIYIDDFGNAITGIRARSLSPDAKISIRGVTLPRVRTFSEVAPGIGFC